MPCALPRDSHLVPLTFYLTLLAVGFSDLLQQRRDIYSKRAERVGVEAIRLSLGWAEEIADGSSAETIEESENPALLNGERELPVQERLRTRSVPDRGSDWNPVALEWPAKRRLE